MSNQNHAWDWQRRGFSMDQSYLSTPSCFVCGGLHASEECQRGSPFPPFIEQAPNDSNSYLPQTPYYGDMYGPMWSEHSSVAWSYQNEGVLPYGYGFEEQSPNGELISYMESVIEKMRQENQESSRSNLDAAMKKFEESHSTFTHDLEVQEEQRIENINGETQNNLPRSIGLIPQEPSTRIERLSQPSSDILLNKSPTEDQGSFFIPISIHNVNIIFSDKAIFELYNSINLMPINIFRRLGLGELKPSSTTLQLADGSLKRTLGIVNGVMVQVQHLYFPVDFVLMDCEEDRDIPMILGRSFLRSGGGWIDGNEGTLNLNVGDEKVVIRLPSDEQEDLEREKEVEEVVSTSPLPNQEKDEELDQLPSIPLVEACTPLNLYPCEEMVIPSTLLNSPKEPSKACLPQIIPTIFEDNLKVGELELEQGNSLFREHSPTLELPLIPPHLRYSKEYWEVIFGNKISGAKRLRGDSQMKEFHLIAKEKKAREVKEPSICVKSDLEHFTFSATSPNFKLRRP